MEYVFHEKGMKLAAADDFEEVHSFDFAWGAKSTEKIYMVNEVKTPVLLKDQPYKSVWDELAPFELLEVYPHINFKLRPDLQRPGKVYVEFVIFPEGDPQDIAFDFHHSLFISDKGDAVKVDNLMGSLKFSQAHAYQLIDQSHKRNTEAELFVQENELKVFVGNYNQELPLTISFDITFLSQFKTDI